jgi:uncharacterized protein (DUF1330 family)
MAAYLIARVHVTDQETYDRYRARTPDVIAQYGGKFIVRGGKNEVVEGDNPELNRMVVVEFSSYEQAQTFYHSPEYQEILPWRKQASQSQVVIVEGV